MDRDFHPEQRFLFYSQVASRAAVCTVSRVGNVGVVDRRGYPALAYQCVPMGVAGASSGGQRECGFASIGYGLTDAEAASFYNIVQKYEASLGR